MNFLIEPFWSYWILATFLGASLFVAWWYLLKFKKNKARIFNIFFFLLTLVSIGVIFMIKSLGESFNEISFNDRELKLICPLRVDIIQVTEIMQLSIDTTSKHSSTLFIKTKSGKVYKSCGSASKTLSEVASAIKHIK
jgi:hypothetical protein